MNGLLFALILAPALGYGQQSAIDSLKTEIQRLEKQRDATQVLINKANSQLSNLIASSENTARPQGMLNARCKDNPCNLFKGAFASIVIAEIPKGETLQINYDTKHYEGFFPAHYNGKIGYIHKSVISIPRNQISRDSTIVVKPTDDMDPMYHASPQRSSSGSGGNTQVIHTGPRGGRYYINKNGNKTYIKKKK